MNKLLIRFFLIIFSMYACSANATNIVPQFDLLVWHISQETSSTWATIATAPNVHKVNLKAPNVNFNWNLGFKAGGVYEVENKFWDAGLYWTYFHAKTSSNVRTATQLIFPEFFSGFTSLNFFFGGHLDWRFVMNILDFEIGHKINMGQSFTLRPKIGIKGGTIYQTINCDWDALLYHSTEKVINNFVGAGPSFGIDTSWNIFKNLNLIGDFTAALLWGNWQLNDTYSRPFVQGVVSATTITTSLNSRQLGTFMCDYFLGLAWTNTKKPSLSVQLGYEMQFWVNQSRFPTFQQLPVHGDLTLQGGTCRILLSL